jgi:5-(aminomethyl)-3-furanmethanol phosphate kinase
MIQRVVVKIGGSLLTRPGLPRRLPVWLRERFPDSQVNVVVGGGAMIDAFRQLDAIHSLDAVEMHWRCVRALRHTAEIVAGWMPDAVWIDNSASYAAHVRDWRSGDRHLGGLFVIAVDAFYGPHSDVPLPCDWSTTSDSIAAWLAIQMEASRLVLVKSCAIPEASDLGRLASLGIVDPCLPSLAGGLAVELTTID